MQKKWTEEFVHWYTHEHQHSSEINFVTPEQPHTGKHIDILKNRKSDYERTKLKHPKELVALNPMKEKIKQ